MVDISLFSAQPLSEKQCWMMMNFPSSCPVLYFYLLHTFLVKIRDQELKVRRPWRSLFPAQVTFPIFGCVNMSSYHL